MKTKVQGEDERPTDVYGEQEHPPTPDELRRVLDRRRRCAWLVRNGWSDGQMDGIEEEAARKR